jgi:hypothetical protein
MECVDLLNPLYIIYFTLVGHTTFGLFFGRHYTRQDIVPAVTIPAYHKKILHWCKRKLHIRKYNTCYNDWLLSANKIHRAIKMLVREPEWQSPHRR